MLNASEITINATQFKAKCLDLMDQIAAHKLSRVTITKRGKPVSVMEAPKDEAKKVSLLGCMAHLRPKDGEIDWDAVQQEARFDHLAPDPQKMDEEIWKQLMGE
jgi:antitoxin (DNA-binding transcriptional repressor) of toxin-antitoxin stability system